MQFSIIDGVTKGLVDHGGCRSHSTTTLQDKDVCCCEEETITVATSPPAVYSMNRGFSHDFKCLRHLGVISVLDFTRF